MKEHIWGSKLQLEVEFRDFKTLSSFGAQEQSLWFRFVGLPRIADQRTSRSNPMTSLGDVKVTDTLAPMSDAAVFNLLEFHHRLDQAGKLRFIIGSSMVVMIPSNTLAEN